MIIIIKGPGKSGKTTIANALRNNQISNGKGALLLDETSEGDLRHQVEKILIGIPLLDGIDASALPWKKDAMVILVGARESVLGDLEALVPGFQAKLGPVYVLTLTQEGGEAAPAKK